MVWLSFLRFEPLTVLERCGVVKFGRVLHLATHIQRGRSTLIEMPLSSNGSWNTLLYAAHILHQPLHKDQILSPVALF